RASDLVLHKGLLVPAGHVLQAVADLVYHAQLDVGFRVDGPYGLAEPRQVVGTGYQDVFQPPVLQMGQHLQPVIGPLAFGDVHPQYLLDPVFVHPQDIVQGLVPDPALLPYLEVHRVQPYNAIDRLQRTFLPFLYLGDDPVGDVAQHLRGYIGVIHSLIWAEMSRRLLPMPYMAMICFSRLSARIRWRFSTI